MGPGGSPVAIRGASAPATAGVPAAAWGEVRDPNRVAVIIGNRTYEHQRLPEARYAHRDAAAFKRYVLDVLGYDPLNVIELADATGADLVSAFGNEGSHEGELWSYLDPARRLGRGGVLLRARHAGSR